MNKDKYLNDLAAELSASHVPEKEDILEEYEEHFRLKLADGYSEDEISLKLGNPKEIAAQFAGIGQAGGSKKATRALIGIGLGFADIIVFMLFIVMLAWVICLAVLSLAALCLAAVLIIRYDISSVLPYIPYPGALIMGIGTIALAVLSAVGTVYCYFYVMQLTKAYLHWHKRTYAGDGTKHPPSPKHPLISSKLRRALRSAALISIVVLAVSYIVGVILLFIYADFKPFWHAWNWFGGGKYL